MWIYQLSTNCRDGKTSRCEAPRDAILSTRHDGYRLNLPESFVVLTYAQICLQKSVIHLKQHKLQLQPIDRNSPRNHNHNIHALFQIRILPHPTARSLIGSKYHRSQKSGFTTSLVNAFRLLTLRHVCLRLAGNSDCSRQGM